MFRRLAFAAALTAAVAALPGRAAAQETFDRAMVAKIRDEGMNRSHVWQMIDTLATVFGPRLTASPAFMRAATWSRDHLSSWGLSDVHMESWPFGRGWELEQFTIEMTAPRFAQIIGYPDAWSPSTNGDVVGTPVLIAGVSADSLEKIRSRLKGAIVMTQPMMTSFIRVDRVNPTDPNAPPPAPVPAASAGRGGRGGRAGGGPSEAQRIAKILHDAGVGAVLRPSRGEHGTVFVQARDAGALGVPTVEVAGENYNNLIRLLNDGIAPTVHVALRAHYLTRDTSGYNVIAELPGTDPRLRDEVVMIGAHLDSWNAATGATDNADGAATVLEAMRILKAVGAKPRRTIRVALWGGEEEGLYGSKAWVQQHLEGDANTTARDKMSMYLNLDPGYGPVYGFFTEGNAAAKSIFDSWLEPFKDIGARKNVTAGIGNTDHLSFIAAGVPGFNPVQDYTNYDVRIHHTNMDTMDRMDPESVKEAAVVFAAFAYNAAMRDGLMPRAIPQR
ncbi:MAG: M20/M25/M40 family metallo-hydrolase [Gemmatimonadaceae bacterium]